ncbi:MAG: hypothetical protein HYX48_08085 [Chlamydiales bacterium]|nr:hypothetical protein [Chlamydiales bacterium]
MSSLGAESPFQINFPTKLELTREDYVDVQTQLRTIDLKPLIDELYEEYKSQGDVTYQDFFYRCTKGLRQTLIKPEQGHLPTTDLIKIGRGGGRCVVCCISYDSNYYNLVTSLAKALEKTGFNGYFYFRAGGFPNPTGQEIQYAGVPYCFKIFTMLEAYQLGFSSVLWIDSTMLPLRNPDLLFQIIESHGAFLFEEDISQNNRYILPFTRKVLQEQTGVDVFHTTYVRTLVFGLKMDTELAQRLIRSYYELVSMGTPFLSCFPEEFVLTAIIGQDPFKGWKGHVHHNKIIKKHKRKQKRHDYVLTFEPPNGVQQPIHFFYYRGHT